MNPVVILGLYWDNGKENGNYRDYRGYKGIIGVILGLYFFRFRVEVFKEFCPSGCAQLGLDT